MSLKTVKSDLFYFAKPTYYCHAVNCYGSWGAGVAREFRNKFPKSYESYQNMCEKGVEPGSVFITNDKVICLFTSKGYSDKLSPPDKILENTKECLIKLLKKLPTKAKVYSNKFNSGLFNVPWPETEAILIECLKVRPDVDWIICSVD